MTGKTRAGLRHARQRPLAAAGDVRLAAVLIATLTGCPSYQDVVASCPDGAVTGACAVAGATATGAPTAVMPARDAMPDPQAKPEPGGEPPGASLDAGAPLDAGDDVSGDSDWDPRDGDGKGAPRWPDGGMRPWGDYDGGFPFRDGGNPFPPPGPTPNGCPWMAPAGSTPCATFGACSYESLQCACLGGLWFCQPLDRQFPGGFCPPVRPQPASPCPGFEGLRCPYGNGACSCRFGQWQCS